MINHFYSSLARICKVKFHMYEHTYNIPQERR